MVFFFHRRWRKGGGKTGDSTSNVSSKCCNGDQVFPESDVARYKGTLKGLIIEEDGSDVLYWKGVIESNNTTTTTTSFNKEVFDKSHCLLAETPPLQPPPPPPVSLPTPPATPARAAPARPSPYRESPSSASPIRPPPMSKTVPVCDSLSQEGSGQAKLKPLSGNNTKPKDDPSMPSQRAPGESLRFDGDIIEALFGSVATTRKCNKRKGKKTITPKTKGINPPSEIYILDVHKSVDTAIIIRSLFISRKNITDAMLEGQGLNTETLEKLVKIAPTEEEQSEIISFDGDITRLAEAESFLYHLLRPFPCAFARFNALLFKSTYNSSILSLNGNLNTLELACKEIKDQEIILKLLIAIATSENCTNVGKSQAFNLSLLDEKTLVGNATLLHLVMAEEECCLAGGRNHGTIGSRFLGVFLSSKFPNVRKAAAIDYDSFATSFAGLASNVAQTRKLLAGCGLKGDEGFVAVIRRFLQEADKGLKEVKEEQARVMELVKTVTKCYGVVEVEDRGKNPVETFVLLYDFFVKLDRACVDIARTLRGGDLRCSLFELFCD